MILAVTGEENARSGGVEVGHCGWVGSGMSFGYWQDRGLLQPESAKEGHEVAYI